MAGVSAAGTDFLGTIARQLSRIVACVAQLWGSVRTLFFGVAGYLATGTNSGGALEGFVTVFMTGMTGDGFGGLAGAFLLFMTRLPTRVAWTGSLGAISRQVF